MIPASPAAFVAGRRTRLDCGRHGRLARLRFPPDPGVSDGRGGGGAAVPLAAAGVDPGIPGGGAGDRSPRAGVLLRRRVGDERGRARGGAVSFPHRPGAQPDAAVGHAAGHLRARHRPARLHRAAGDDLPPADRRAQLAGLPDCRSGAGSLVDRAGHAAARGEGRAADAPRAEGVRHPAAARPGRGAVAGAGRLAGARHRRAGAPDLADGREDDRRAGRRDPGRALPAQSLLPDPGQRPGRKR